MKRMGKLNGTEAVVYSANLSIDVHELISCRFGFGASISSDDANITEWNICVSKCREMVLLEPQILAYPVLGRRRDITVIMSQVSYSDAVFRAKVRELGLEEVDHGVADNEAMKKAIKFTLLTRLAPEWNSVGKLLVMGENFMQNTSPIYAISLEISIKDNEILFHLKGGQIKIFPSHPDEYGISPLLWEAIRQDPCFHIAGSKLKIKCGPFMLPSLRTACIQNITARLPVTCPYKTYPEMCRHWEAVYGYVLPKDIGEQFYITAKFAGGGMLYTYPSICVHGRPPAICANVDPLPIIEIFVETVKVKMSFICGKSLNFQSINTGSLPSYKPRIGFPAKIPKSNVRQCPTNQTKLSDFYIQAKTWGTNWENANAIPFQKEKSGIQTVLTQTPLNFSQQFRYEKGQVPNPRCSALTAPLLKATATWSRPTAPPSKPTARPSAIPNFTSTQPSLRQAITRHPSFEEFSASQPPLALTFPADLAKKIIANVESLTENYEEPIFKSDRSTAGDKETPLLSSLLTSRQKSSDDLASDATTTSSFGKRFFPGAQPFNGPFSKSSETTLNHKGRNGCDSAHKESPSRVTERALSTTIFSAAQSSKRKEDVQLQDANKRLRSRLEGFADDT